MTTFGLPIVATLLLWWASTGAILYLDGLDRRTFSWSMAGATGTVGNSPVRAGDVERRDDFRRSI